MPPEEEEVKSPLKTTVDDLRREAISTKDELKTAIDSVKQGIGLISRTPVRSRIKKRFLNNLK